MIRNLIIIAGIQLFYIYIIAHATYTYMFYVVNNTPDLFQTLMKILSMGRKFLHHKLEVSIYKDTTYASAIYILLSRSLWNHFAIASDISQY